MQCHCDFLLNCINFNQQGDAPLCDPEPHSHSPSTKVIQTNASTIDMPTTETACGLGDVTFKSFICPGGEVEVAGSSVCAEEDIILEEDQAMKTACETEDSVISESLIVQSCSHHIEHPYHHPEMKDASLLDIDAERLCEISNIQLASTDLDDVTQDLKDFQHDLCGKTDVTWKSFTCDGGEVAVSDVTRQQDETIPLPKAQLGEPLQDNGVNLTNLSVCGQLCQAEHADHPYCRSENGVCVITTSSETTNNSKEPVNGLSDVTFKSFNCTGGEIHISDGTKLGDDTVPLQADQTATDSESHNYGIDPSMLASDQDVQNVDDHVDHPYCNIESCPSTPSGNLAVTEEPSLFNLDAVDEVKQISLEGPEAITFSSIISARNEIEESDGTRLSQKMSPLPDNHAVICKPVYDSSVPASVTQDHIQDNNEQPNSHVENNEVVADTDPPAISTPSLTNMSLKALDDKSVNSLMQETSEKDSVHPGDCALPSVCSHLTTSAESQTPVEVHLEHVSQMLLSSGSPESPEAKDSALGSSGPVLCDSSERPHAKNLPEVLKVLSECPSASVLRFGLLSPVIRASLPVLKTRSNPAVDQFLSDDSALEGEKSLLAPVNVDPTGLWAEYLESPMPCPLLNSTALGCKAQPGPATELVEDVGLKPCAVPQPEVDKPVLDIPLIPDGPLQQQLRQMAEFLFLASGKMGPAAHIPPPAAITVPLAPATPAESHSVCVGTTPMKWEDRSVNTSGQFERKRVFSVVDSCTLTDPLLWK